MVEKFTGEYGMVSAREFHSRMGAIFGLGKTVGFGATSLSTVYYIADLTGTNGTTALCGYAINLIGNTSFTGTG